MKSVWSMKKATGFYWFEGFVVCIYSSVGCRKWDSGIMSWYRKSYCDKSNRLRTDWDKNFKELEIWRIGEDTVLGFSRILLVPLLIAVFQVFLKFTGTCHRFSLHLWSLDFIQRLYLHKFILGLFIRVVKAWNKLLENLYPMMMIIWLS